MKPTIVVTVVEADIDISRGIASSNMDDMFFYEVDYLAQMGRVSAFR